MPAAYLRRELQALLPVQGNPLPNTTLSQPDNPSTLEAVEGKTGEERELEMRSAVPRAKHPIVGNESPGSPAGGQSVS